LCDWKLNQQEYINISTEMVNQINYRSIHHAQEQVISLAKDKLEEILKKYNK